MSENNQKRRLTDLVENPRETPDVELKDWLDLRGNPDHKAQLAKALLALANHGGGYLLIGFEDGPDPKRSERDEPSTLAGYSQDIINGIVQSYADPPFHCDVEHVVHSSGKSHPVVIVPGMHRVPIRAKRSGPEKNMSSRILFTFVGRVQRVKRRKAVASGTRFWQDASQRGKTNF